MARPKGALGKNKAFLLGRLQDLYGKSFNPVMKMAAQAVELDKLAELDPSVANMKESIASWDRIAGYTHAKMKAVEITQDANLTVSVQRKRYDGAVKSNSKGNDINDVDA